MGALDDFTIHLDLEGAIFSKLGHFDSSRIMIN